jgi:hypothetical protein
VQAGPLIRRCLASATFTEGNDYMAFQNSLLGALMKATVMCTRANVLGETMMISKTLAATVLAILLTGCAAGPTASVKGDNTGGEQTTTASPSTKAAPEEDGVTATFKVTTNGKASVTWGTSSGTSQAEIKAGEWTKKVKFDEGWDAAVLTVTNGDFMKKVKISCEILINGVSKSKNSASGTAAVATCNASSID